MAWSLALLLRFEVELVPRRCTDWAASCHDASGYVTVEGRALHHLAASTLAGPCWAVRHPAPRPSGPILH